MEKNLQFICEPCRDSLSFLPYEKSCEKCSDLLYSGSCNFCENNTAHQNLDWNLSLFAYEGLIQEWIVMGKFSFHPSAFRFFASCMIQSIVEESFLENPKKFPSKKNIPIAKQREIASMDRILPVPLSRKRLKERNFNPSEILARKLSEKLSIPFSKRILVKIRNNKSQSNLGWKERFSNPIGCYRVSPPKKTTKTTLENQKILLIDDVFTTGTTVQECAKMLKQAGASMVSSLTIARSILNEK